MAVYDADVAQNAYNRFTNLDGIEDRIIYYLISPTNKTNEQLKQVHNIWKLLVYDDIDALNKPLPKYSDVIKLIDNSNNEQTDKRIFRTPHLEDAWLVQCSMLKIYVDSIIPQNRLLSVVNIGIDIVTHTKIINVRVPDNDDSTIIDEVDGIQVKIETKSRISVLTRAVLSLLNGQDIAGVGQMQFTSELSRYNQARYSIWNNRAYEGIKLCIGCQMSGVS